MVDDIAAILANITPLLGRPVRNVQLGYSTFITLEFGEARVRDDVTHGEWHLWVYGADWRIDDDTRVFAGSGDDRRVQLESVACLEGLVLQQVAITPPAFDTTFMFEQDVRLQVFATYAQGMAYWMLFVPDGNVLSVGPGTAWSYRPSSAASH